MTNEGVYIQFESKFQNSDTAGITLVNVVNTYELALPFPLGTLLVTTFEVSFCQFSKKWLNYYIVVNV